MALNTILRGPLYASKTLYALLKTQLPGILSNLSIVTCETILSYLDYAKEYETLFSKRGLIKNYYFPWKDDEKSRMRTQKLIEENQYSAQKRKNIFRQLWVTHSPLSKFVNIITSYHNIKADLKINHQSEYLNEIKDFLHHLLYVLQSEISNCSRNIFLIHLAFEAIESIIQNDWHNKNFIDEFGKKFSFFKKFMNWQTSLPSTPLYYLVFFFTQKSLFDDPHETRQNYFLPDITLFEFLISNYQYVKYEPERLNYIFEIARAVLESKLKLFHESKFPKELSVNVNKETVFSLYSHINNHLRIKHPLPLKDDSHRERMNSMIRALDIVKVKFDRIDEVAKNSGFLISLLEYKSGIRLLNIHQKFNILQTFYDYINSFQENTSEFVASKKLIYSIRKLIDKILNTPNSSLNWYLILKQIKNSISKNKFNNLNLNYVHVLKEVITKILPHLETPQEDISTMHSDISNPATEFVSGKPIQTNSALPAQLSIYRGLTPSQSKNNKLTSSSKGIKNF